MTNPNDEVRDQAKNPSYDTSRPPRNRLADFLGKYHVTLNGVTPHEPYERHEDDGGGVCCQDHIVEIMDFVEQLLASERKQLAQDIKNWTKGKTVTKDKLRNYLNQIIKESEGR